jgi:hypothetical protein
VYTLSNALDANPLSLWRIITGGFDIDGTHQQNAGGYFGQGFRSIKKRNLYEFID